MDRPRCTFLIALSLCFLSTIASAAWKYNNHTDEPDYYEADTNTNISGWTDGGDNVYLTTSTDNVGIGTTTPTAKLEVDGNAIADTPTLGTHLTTKQYVDLAVTSLGVRYYMDDTASGVSDYKLCQLTASEDSESSDAHATVVDDEYLRGWIAPTVGTPSKLIAGVYDWHMFAEKTAGTKTLRLYWTLVERKADTSETVIATSAESNIVTSKTYYNVLINLSEDYEIASDSYVVGKVYAAVSGVGNAPSVTLYYEGDSDSHWEIPVNTEILNDSYVEVAGDDMTGTLTVDGNIGIGTTSPTGALHVGIGTTAPQALFVDASTGNVGIGTTGPTRKLDIEVSSAGGVTDAYGMVRDDATDIWKLSYDDTTAPYDVIYEANSKNLQFNPASGVTGIYIKSDGNVGIGTTGPITILDVGGEITAGSNATFEVTVGSNGDVGGFIHGIQSGFAFPNSNCFIPTDGAAGLTQGTTDIGQDSTYRFDKVFANTALFYGSTDNYFAGNVGIGTTGPEVPLDVQSIDNTAGIQWRRTGGNIVGRFMVDTGGEGQLILENGNSVNTVTIDGDIANDSYMLGSLAIGGTAGSNAAGDAKLYIDGNVGIGTTTPVYKLETIGDVRFSGNVGVGTTCALRDNSGAGDLEFSEDGGQSWTDIGTGGGGGGWTDGEPNPYVTDITDNVGIGTTVPTGKLHVGVGVTAPQALFVHATTGNVGIGTTSPAAIIDIIGNIAVDGAIGGDNEILKMDGANLVWEADASGGSTALDDIGDPDAATSISLDDTETITINSAEDSGTVLTINMTDADAGGDIFGIEMIHAGDANSAYKFMRFYDNTNDEQFAINSNGNVDTAGTITSGSWMLCEYGDIKNRKSSDSAATTSELNLGRKRDGDPTDNVADDDYIGEVNFKGYHTNGYDTGATIRAVVNGTPGDGDMPSELIFATSADASATPTTAMTISSAQVVTFANDLADSEISDTLTSSTCTGNAATVTNATLTTALTVNTGTLTLTANAANNSVLTIGAGAVSVSGANTGDNTVCTSGTATTAATLATPRAIGGVNFDGSAAITPTTIVVADTADATAFVGLWDSATGSLLPKTDAGFAYDAAGGNVGIGYTDPKGKLCVNGNVGIGTTAPVAPLDVNGVADFSTTVTITAGALTDNTIDSDDFVHEDWGEVTNASGSVVIDDSVTVTGWVMGASTATTPAEGDNDTSLATTAYVIAETADILDGTDAFTDFNGTDILDSDNYNADSIDEEHINWADIDYLGNEGARPVFLWAASATLDDSSPPAITIQESTGTGTPRRRYAAFDPTTDEIIYWDVIWGGWSTASVVWMANDTGANEDAIFFLGVSATTEADTDSMAEDAIDTYNTESEDVNTTEAYRLIVTPITLSNIDSADVGDFVTLVFGRDADDSIGDADADALTSDALVLGVLLE